MGAALAMLGCTDVDLFTAVDEDPALARTRLASLVCGPAQEVVPVPYKVLFVIDTSASNLVNETDPPLFNGLIDVERGVTRREAAVRSAISAHIGQPNVSFGIITFNDFPQVQTFGFTRDLGALDAAVRNIGAATGWTNYSDTILRVDEVIQGDLARLEAAEARRTHYLVFWLSDGYPTRGITYDDPKVLAEALGRGVNFVLTNSTGRAAEVRFNTAFIGGGTPDTNPLDTAEVRQQKLDAWTRDAANARQLLSSLASVGKGLFTDIPSGQPFTFPISTTTVQRRFVIAPSVMAANLNVVFGSSRPLVDSDADGVADVDDEAPTNPDADGDGVRDGIELQLPSSCDPKDAARPGTCAAKGVDTDGDGLFDCEEALLGSDPKRLDTDDDGYLDSLEVLGRTSPVHGSSVDRDADGLTDDIELRAHLDPRQVTTPEAARRFSYDYQVAQRESRPDGSLCYQVSLANVVMLETAAMEGRPVGVNTVQLVVPFWPDDGGGPMSFFRTQVTGVLRMPNYMEPTSGTFVVESDKFSLMRTP
jgi:hypothetical protein